MVNHHNNPEWELFTHDDNDVFYMGLDGRDVELRHEKGLTIKGQLDYTGGYQKYAHNNWLISGLHLRAEYFEKAWNHQDGWSMYVWGGVPRIGQNADSLQPGTIFKGCPPNSLQHEMMITNKYGKNPIHPKAMNESSFEPYRWEIVEVIGHVSQL